MIKSFILSVLIAAIDCVAQVSPWAAYGPPGQVTALALHPSNPSTIFAGTHMAGVYMSTDAGESWHHSSRGIPLSELLSGNSISRIVFHPYNPSIVYIGTGFNTTGGGKGFYKSTDGGRTWILKYDSFHPILAVSINPKVPTELFITVPLRLLRSRDGGETFQEVLQDFGGSNFGSPVEFDNNDSITIYFLDNNGNFYKSSDSGDTWEKTSHNKSIAIWRLFQDESNGDFYIFSSQGVFKLVAGKGFVELNNGLPRGHYGMGDMAYDRQRNVFYVASESGVYKSLDKGETWQKIFDAPEVMTIIFFQEMLWAGTAVGVYRSTDSGKTWQSFNKNLAAAYVNHVAVAETDNQFIYAATSKGVFQSTDGGCNWQHLPQVGGTHYVNQVAIDNTDKNTAYAAFGEYYGVFFGIFKTWDGGITWTDISPFPDYPATAIDIQYDDPRQIYVGAPSSLAKSSDRGQNWELLWGQSGASEVNAVRISISNPKVIYLGISSNDPSSDGIWITENGGNTWARRVNGLDYGISYTGIISLAVHPLNQSVAYAGTWFSNIYKTTNLGRNWKVLSRGLPNREKRITGLATHKNNPSAVFAAISGYYLAPEQRGIYKSIDEGENWERLPESNIYNNYVTSLNYFEANGRELFYIGTRGQGIFTNAFVETNVARQRLDKAKKSILFGNYPNPFNTATFIKYELHTSASVLLKVYNTTGQEVRTLVNELQVEGLHVVHWDGKNDFSRTVSSGIYVFKLQVGDHIQSRKMLHLR